LKNIRILVAILFFEFVSCGTAPGVIAQIAPPESFPVTYYIAADEVMWNYIPHGSNLSGLPVSESEGPPRQMTFRKAVYREYTDATFTTLKPRPPQWEHLGILGPLIRAEVGNTIKVVFKNNAKIFASMHPHGLAYAKQSEGALYADGLPNQEKMGARVAPGQTFTYLWTVPERAGPAHGDASSVLWAYHSHFIEPSDMNAGLIGPIIVTARGMSKIDGSPQDVDREFVTAFAVFDETSSLYFEANTIHQRPATASMRKEDPAFREPYLMDTINGLVEGNLPMLTMKKGERVRWYLLSNGNPDDVHTPHWHGQTVTFMHMRMDMVNLLPMTMLTADMQPDNVGTWLFHCHVNDHLEGGMVARFTVTP
jgi:FtsP/CotA-like multicopper oxidase with cupredoxin domain